MRKLAVVIDDDEDDIYFLRQTLAAVDPTIECLSFDLPIDAIKVLTDPLHPAPNYVFIDYNMPMLNGLECYEKLKSIKKFEHTRFILNSTTVHDELKRTFLAMGGHLVFNKPLSLEKYKILVELALVG